MKNLLLLVVLGVFLGGGAGAAIADGPADANCDFESGLDRWRGDGRIDAEESGNKVCVLKKSGKRTREITHEIELSGTDVFEVHYRVRAMPGSEGVKIRRSIRTSDGSVFSGSELKPDGKWVAQKFGVKGEEGNRKTDKVLSIVFYEGEGVIQIDDIEVLPK